MHLQCNPLNLPRISGWARDILSPFKSVMHKNQFMHIISKCSCWRWANQCTFFKQELSARRFNQMCSPPEILICNHWAATKHWNPTTLWREWTKVTSIKCCFSLEHAFQGLLISTCQKMRWQSCVRVIFLHSALCPATAVLLDSSAWAAFFSWTLQ